jgi:hypothetical protein
VKVSGRFYKAHRLVMAVMLGRMPGPGEAVHHVDGNPRNNHPSNLQLVRTGQHTRDHLCRVPLVATCPMCQGLFLRVRDSNWHETCSRTCANRLKWRRRRLGLRPLPEPEKRRRFHLGLPTLGAA